MDNWTRQTRMFICSVVAFPLAISMISVGAVSIERCSLQQQDASNGSSSDLNTSLPSTILESNQTLIQHTKGIKKNPKNILLYYIIAYNSTFWSDTFKQKTTSCQQKTTSNLFWILVQKFKVQLVYEYFPFMKLAILARKLKVQLVYEYFPLMKHTFLA